jgi:hypothetical protein
VAHDLSRDFERNRLVISNLPRAAYDVVMDGATQASLCSHCGSSAQAGTIFCKGCGATLQPTIPLISPAPLQLSPKLPTWRRVFRGLLKTIAAAAVGVFILLLIILAWASRNWSLVSDAKLRDNFYAKQDDFKKLASMSEQDRPLIRIRNDLTLMQTDFGVKQNVGLTVDRWQEYRVLFKKLGLKEGLERTDTVPSALLLFSYCEGSAIDADCKGYAYSAEPLSPLMTSLDEPRPGYVFKQLHPNWYLFRWVD